VHESVNPDNKVRPGTKCNLLQVSHAASLPTHPAGDKPETWRHERYRARANVLPAARTTRHTRIINCPARCRLHPYTPPLHPPPPPLSPRVAAIAYAYFSPFSAASNPRRSRDLAYGLAYNVNTGQNSSPPSPSPLSLALALALISGRSGRVVNWGGRRRSIITTNWTRIPFSPLAS